MMKAVNQEVEIRRQRPDGDRRQENGRWVTRPALFVSRRWSAVLSVFYFMSSVVLAFMSAGCMVSNHTSSMQTSSDRQHVIAASDNPAPADDFSEIDDEFGLLEEELTEEMIVVADPLEPVNRVMFAVNDKLYFWVVKPVAKAYKGVIPESARLGIRNFFKNVSTPARLVNCLLQGKNDAANTELRRFAINTTVGILGFGDPALDKYGLKPVKEDLGQTLAVYGLGDGFYIVWPFFGPSTARDSIGMAGDQFLNPLRYVDPREVSIGVSVVKFTNASSFQIGTYEDFKAQALEPYVAMREFYIQYRHKQIQE
jgi:phospholipid-binding lipoprotein MlaA